MFPDWRPEPRQPRDEGGGAVLVPLDVTATAAGGSTFTARIPVDPETVDGALVDA